MHTIYEYLTEPEARAKRAYRQAYYDEHMRLYKRGYSEDR